MYKLSFLLHSLLENGARMTPKRRSVFSLIFIVNCISKFNIISVFIKGNNRIISNYRKALFACRFFLTFLCGIF